MERHHGSGAPGGHRSHAALRYAVPLIVGLVSLLVYLATLAPGLTWEHDSGDGGELAAAARILGVPHPPGYPTYMLLVHPFTLLPMAEVATRTNLFSAVCAAGAAALLAGALQTLGTGALLAIATGLALAFSPLLWAQAIVTEVYALNALFAAALLAMTVSARPCHGASWLAVLLGWVWGVSLGNHLTALFLAPLVVLALLRLGRRWVLGLMGVALGLLVYLYLPLRAAADPAINWGDPQTLERFWWVVSGGPYRGFAFSLPSAYLPGRLFAWAALAVRQFGWPGVLLAAVGAASARDRDRAFFAATGGVMLLCSVFAVGYDTTDSYLYLMPSVVCLAVWMGLGARDVVAMLRARWHRAARVAAFLALVSTLAAGLARFPAMDLRGDRVAGEFAAGVLGAAPPEAVLLSRQDRHTFTLWYEQIAMQRRADLVVVDVDLLEYTWYAASLARRLDLEDSAALALLQPSDPAPAAARLRRPVCVIRADEPDVDCAVH